MPPTPHRTRVRPSPSTSKSPRRRGLAAEFVDSDNDEAAFCARYHVSVRSAKNLKREGFRGLTNPYCQLNVGRQGPYTTDVVFDSVNPSWQNNRQTFEFREAKGPHEDKLTLACFNSGDVPELIGRLSVALSHATHKVISLPMFRKDLGGSQVWAGSVEIELHYIPEGEAGSPARGGRVGRPALDETDVKGGGHNPYLPMSPSTTTTTTTSLASSFVKAALSLPHKPRASGGADDGAAAAAVQAELLALSPRTATRRTEKKEAMSATKSPALAKSSSLPGTEQAAASSCSSSVGAHKGGGGSGRYGSAAAVAQEDLLPLSPRMARGAEAAAAAAAAEAARGRGYSMGDGAGGWRWKSFFCGVVFAALLVLGGLWAVGVPLLSGQLGFGLRVLEDGENGRQAVVLIHGSKIAGLADRHLVVFVGEQEVCRGGVPAPAPPTEGSSWAYDLWSSDSAAAAAAGEGGDGGKGRSGRGGGREQHMGDNGGESDCGRWCSFCRWCSLCRRLAAPLYAARRDVGGGGGGGLGTDL
ncbi:unnamed protein product [Ectocarpus sp. 4 AP-2014]